MYTYSIISILAAVAVAQNAGQSITQALQANSGTLSTLNTLLATVPQLTQALATTSNITIFAPSNQAFANAMMANPGLAAMTKNATFVTDLLEYHIATGVFPSAMFMSTPQFASTAYQVPAVSGMRPQMVELTKLNNEALVISGFKQVSRVQQADIFFNGGVMHVIDTILTEPDLPSVTALDTGLTSLAGALVKVNMVAGVDSLQEATIFAPSNAAFGAVGNVVSSANNELLSEVLEYHVVSGVIANSAELMRMAMAQGGSTTLRTVQGTPLVIREEQGALFANNARIKIADVLTSNGLVHVIDNVLNPLATTAQPDVSRATPAPNFAGASPLNGLPFTSGIMPTTTLLPASVTQQAAGAFAVMPTAALMGAVGAAAMLANM